MPDFLPDETTLSDRESWYIYEQLLVDRNLLSPLAEQHGHDGRDSYYVLHDATVIWDIPGLPQLVALHVTRDPDRGSFSMERSCEPTLPLAQRWLATRGADPDGFTLRFTADDRRPADERTELIETRLRNSGQRYRVVDEYTHEEPSETWVLAIDTTAHAGERPYRLFVEATDLETGVYTVREGAFATHEEAQDWLAERKIPLPEHTLSATELRRTQAARARSTDLPTAAGAAAPAPSPGPPASNGPTHGLRSTR